jgi:hypothetical protein
MIDRHYFPFPNHEIIPVLVWDEIIPVLDWDEIIPPQGDLSPHAWGYFVNGNG